MEVPQVASDSSQRKVEAAAAALQEVRSGMRLGLGTGSTAAEFVKLLGAKLASGELGDIVGVCTSEATEQLAKSLAIPTSTIQQVPVLDLAIDGADEIDAQLRLIKGRGAALLREKIVEQCAKRFIVIADDSKEVDRLGVGPFPVEVVRFATTLLFGRFEVSNLLPKLRLTANGDPLITDEGHHIIDIMIPKDRDIADVVEEIRRYAGVVETGFFPDEATEAIIATSDGIRRRFRP
jgi:ribose 5-phosphate isomerase A